MVLHLLPPRFSRIVPGSDRADIFFLKQFGRAFELGRALGKLLTLSLPQFTRLISGDSTTYPLGLSSSTGETARWKDARVSIISISPVSFFSSKQISRPPPPGPCLYLPASALMARGLLVCGSVSSNPVEGGPGLQVSEKLVHRPECWGDIHQPAITHHWPRIPGLGSRAFHVMNPQVSRSGRSLSRSGLARRGPVAHCSLPTLSPGLLAGPELQFVGRGRQRARARVGRVRHSPWLHSLREHQNPQ